MSMLTNDFASVEAIFWRLSTVGQKLVCLSVNRSKLAMNMKHTQKLQTPLTALDAVPGTAQTKTSRNTTMYTIQPP